MLLPLLLALSTPQAADSNEGDLRCIAVFSIVVGTAPEERKAPLSSGIMFFNGRILGRTPGYDLEKNIRRLFAAMPSAEALKPDLARCGAEMQKRGTYLIEMGKRLQTNPPKPAAAPKPAAPK